MSIRLAFFLFVFFGLSAFSAKGQDLIIRIYGDTIHSKIDREDERFIYYRTERTSRGETEVIARKEVREILYGIDTSIKTKIPPKKFEKGYKSFQVSVHAGYSRILSTDDLYGDDFESVYDEMRNGFFVDARANYFFNKGIGLGVLYSTSGYQTDSDIPVLVSLPSGTDLIGELSHDRTLNYYALNLAFRINQSSTVNFQIDVGMGLLTFEDQGDFIGAYNLTSSALGGHLSASFQLGLGEGFYLPAFFSLKGFSLSSFELNPSSEMNPELALGLQSLYDNLEGGITAGRLQLGLGLGFSF
ncbi:hypothetical protein O3Q51_01490 [Cryomorphaceae bacterium 1068]|nr:hypothetical protein [Cryomorphaceae bacterium 1068]